jgi:hypothetical protein
LWLEQSKRDESDREGQEYQDRPDDGIDDACEIAPKRDPSGERSYVFECTCESVFGNRVAFRAKLDPSKFAILIVK